jgi:COP9 signalosome complex subunit 2
VKLFLKCVEEDKDKGEWGFRSLKRLVKMNFEKGNFDNVKLYFKKLLTYLKTNRNFIDRKFISLFEFIWPSQGNPKKENYDLYRELLEVLCIKFV